MKKLFALFLLVMSTSVFASGKLQLKQKYDSSSEPTKYSLGLAVYEHLFWNLYLNSWNGGGAVTASGKDPWLKSDQAIEAHVGPFSVGVGGNVKYLPHIHTHESELYVTVGATLWK